MHFFVTSAFLTLFYGVCLCEYSRFENFIRMDVDDYVNDFFSNPDLTLDQIRTEIRQQFLRKNETMAEIPEVSHDRTKPKSHGFVCEPPEIAGQSDLFMLDRISHAPHTTHTHTRQRVKVCSIAIVDPRLSANTAPKFLLRWQETNVKHRQFEIGTYFVSQLSTLFENFHPHSLLFTVNNARVLGLRKLVSVTLTLTLSFGGMCIFFGMF